MALRGTSAQCYELGACTISSVDPSSIFLPHCKYRFKILCLLPLSIRYRVGPPEAIAVRNVATPACRLWFPSRDGAAASGAARPALQQAAFGALPVVSWYAYSLRATSRYAAAPALPVAENHLCVRNVCVL